MKQGTASRFKREDVQEVYPNYDASQSGYSYVLDTAQFTNGKHEIKIVAVGSDGTTNAISRTIEIKNQYLGVIDNPSKEQVLSGKETISGWYLYGKEISSIEVYIDGVKQGNATRYKRSDVQDAYPTYDASQAGYSYELDTKKLINGNHTMKVVAVGKDGTQHEISLAIYVKN